MIPERDILYVAAGSQHSSSMQRARALERLGHRLTVVNVCACTPRNICWLRFNNYSGGRLAEGYIKRALRRIIANRRFDLAWVDSGQGVGPSTVALLRTATNTVVNYNLDDPTGARDGGRWNLFRTAIPSYDLLVTVRRETESELRARGARNVLRVFRSYDEVEHRPLPADKSDLLKWGSEVVFVGSWMPERGGFMRQLIARGVPLTIYGDHWQRAPEIGVIQSVWKHQALYGEDYAKAIQYSKVALGLLSKGNRDLHTQRSTEIPALGGMLCAERTSEHIELYREGEEAVFWSDVDECARHCLALLADEPRRQRIAAAGSLAVRLGGFRNESVLAQVLEALDTAYPERVPR